MLLDLWQVYQFVRRLATPFKDWEAFKLGIIDENGKILKSRKDLLTRSERSAFGIFDVMILNLKRALGKLPGGSTRLGSYAAALYLIKEWNHFTDLSILTENTTNKEISESVNLFFNGYSDYTTLIENVNKKMTLNQILEDAPTMSAGSGAIAGIGVGPDGEPGFLPSHVRKHKKKAKKSSKQLKSFRRVMEEAKKAPEDVCWPGYEMVGFKIKNGKKVPNCIPKD